MWTRTANTPGPGSAPAFFSEEDKRKALEAGTFGIRPAQREDGKTGYGVFHLPSNTLLTPLTTAKDNPAITEHLHTALLTAALCRKELK